MDFSALKLQDQHGPDRRGTPRMSDERQPVDWSKTTFEGSRREQLRRARAMTVRQRLEALDQLMRLAERMQTMPRHAGHDSSGVAPKGPEAGDPHDRTAKK